MQRRNQIFKIALIGDASTGKTTFLQRYLTGQFPEDPRATLGVNFCTKTLEVGEEIITLQIWDFGGNERFQFLVSLYCKNVDAILFVYDVTNSTSIFKLEKCVKEFRDGKTKPHILVIGTKSDLNSHRLMPPSEAVAYAQAQGTIGIIEVSSKTGENVSLAFETIIKRLLNLLRKENNSHLKLNIE